MKLLTKVCIGLLITLSLFLLASFFGFISFDLLKSIVKSLIYFELFVLLVTFILLVMMCMRREWKTALYIFGTAVVSVIVWLVFLINDAFRGVG
jgi:hypothetical protein